MNLVFASGFLIPQHFSGISYFRGLKRHLDDGGRHRAIFPAVPPLATAAERAVPLADAIAGAFPQGPVHVIAHSMGGLDSRVLIAGNLRGLSDPGRIRSLTTLSTPHKGSPVADLLLGKGPVDVPPLARQLIGGAIAFLGIPTGALEDLTTDGARKIPDPTTSHGQIHYRSYFASGRPGFRRTCFLLGPTHDYISSQTQQDNDGLVALASAQYGQFQQPSWQCDHADITGHDLDNLFGEPDFKHLDHIDAIIADLEKLPGA